VAVRAFTETSQEAHGFSRGRNGIAPGNGPRQAARCL